MKSRLWVMGLLALAASLYAVDGRAWERMAEGMDNPDMGYQEGHPSAEPGDSSAVEDTEQKGEIETGTVPSADPGRSDWKSGVEKLPGESGETVEGGGLPFRSGIDTGP